MPKLPHKWTLAELLPKHGLSITSEFVPFSTSRNKGSKTRSLNWIITLLKDGRKVLTTDYMAGIGHCPSAKRWPHQTLDSEARIKFETEHGCQALGEPTSARGLRPGIPILPDPCSVVACLCLDASVLDYSSFEEWALNSGWDPDSRKAEVLYQDCLKLALQLRNALSDAAFRELQEACHEY